MGQQQILLIVLSVILVGIAIAVGITMFTSYAVTSNQEAMILDMITISTMAYQHRLKPTTMGGGSGTFEGFDIPSGMKDNENAEYEISVETLGGEGDGETEYGMIRIEGTSHTYGGKIIAQYNLELEMVPYTDGDGENSFTRGSFYLYDWPE